MFYNKTEFRYLKFKKKNIKSFLRSRFKILRKDIVKNDTLELVYHFTYSAFCLEHRRSTTTGFCKSPSLLNFYKDSSRTMHPLTTNPKYQLNIALLYHHFHHHFSLYLQNWTIFQCDIRWKRLLVHITYLKSNGFKRIEIRSVRKRLTGQILASLICYNLREK